MASPAIGCIEFPLVTAIEGHDFTSQRLAKLAGLSIEVTRFEEQATKRFAVIRTTSIMQALVDNPQYLFWKGYYDARQPGSYGQAQHEIVDPEFTIELDDTTVFHPRSDDQDIAA